MNLLGCFLSLARTSWMPRVEWARLHTRSFPPSARRMSQVVSYRTSCWDLPKLLPTQQLHLCWKPRTLLPPVMTRPLRTKWLELLHSVLLPPRSLLLVPRWDLLLVAVTAYSSVICHKFPFLVSTLICLCHVCLLVGGCTNSPQPSLSGTADGRSTGGGTCSRGACHYLQWELHRWTLAAWTQPGSFRGYSNSQWLAESH